MDSGWCDQPEALSSLEAWFLLFKNCRSVDIFVAEFGCAGLRLHLYIAINAITSVWQGVEPV